ncbi:MAG: hypothetical protein WAN20_20595 [Pseudonocardiaceae bacterium]|jgi:hypothetical protein|nr:hypothetical protein [Pseudonocardiaceae bacterium]
MSATLTLTAGSGPATIASSDPGAAYLYSAITNGCRDQMAEGQQDLLKWHVGVVAVRPQLTK